MARTLRSDKLLFWATLLLVGASIVMVYSATAVPSVEKGDTPYFFVVKQVIAAVVGTLLLLAIMRVDYHEYRRPALIWALLAVTAVGLFAVFFFAERNGTHRWIILGGTSIQPSELAKPGFNAADAIEFARSDGRTSGHDRRRRISTAFDLHRVGD